jgi:hypothetical protein
VDDCQEHSRPAALLLEVFLIGPLFCFFFKRSSRNAGRTNKYTGDVAFLGLLPDSFALQIFKADPEFQAILAQRNKQNAGKRARIPVIEKSY